jgi:outer membrane immunogenic protein
MKRATLTLSILCAFNAFVFAGPEQYSGKEMKQVAPMPPSCDYTWTGFYIGGNAGYGWGNGDTHFEPLPDANEFEDLDPTTLSPDPDGFIAGGQFGYNHQWGKFVLGGEADFQWSDMAGTQTVSPIVGFQGDTNRTGSFLQAHQDIEWFGTARLRVGFTPTCRLLLYVTGGLAFGEVNYSANSDYIGTSYPASVDRLQVGWTGGTGFEYAFNRRWSVKAEYLYVDLCDESLTADAVREVLPNAAGAGTNGAPGTIYQVRYDWDTTAHIIRGGLNFKF